MDHSFAFETLEKTKESAQTGISTLCAILIVLLLLKRRNRFCDI